MIDIENMSILVVDDMKSMRLTIRKMLRNLNIGKTLRFAENGRDGLEVLHSAPCDLAIIDWNMPVMNGTQMMSALRKDKLLRDILVVMVTAENERDIVSEVAESEIDAYLLKPLTLESLDTKIKAVVRNANNPDPATKYMMKARECEEAEDYKGAIEQIRLALTHKPSASRILRKLGLMHFKIGKPAIGEKCLQKAMSVNRQDTISRDLLGRYYLEKQEYEKAARIYLEVMSLSTKYFDSAMDLGKKLIVNGYKSMALELFQKVVARAGKKTGFQDSIVDICLDNMEYAYPKKLLDQSIQENPSNYETVHKAGIVHYDTNEFDKALTYFEKVNSNKANHIEAKLHIAKIHLMNRKVIMADDFVNQVLRIDPNNQEALALRRQL
ncbi:MAG: response regulator [Desulfobacteraceae bacterium]|nr:response regulator [Desulfobacteraceae bacterium]